MVRAQLQEQQRVGDNGDGAFGAIGRDYRDAGDKAAKGGAKASSVSGRVKGWGRVGVRHVSSPWVGVMSGYTHLALPQCVSKTKIPALSRFPRKS